MRSPSRGRWHRSVSPTPAARPTTHARAMRAADLVRSLNRQLGAGDRRARGRARDRPGFDARHSATARRYRYLVWDSPAADPLLAPVAWHVAGPLDLRAMAGGHRRADRGARLPGVLPPPPGAGARRAAAPARHFRPRMVGVGVGSRGGRRPARPPAPPDASAGDPSRSPTFSGPSPAACFASTSRRAFCHQMVRSAGGHPGGRGPGEGHAARWWPSSGAGTRAGAETPAPPHGLCLVPVVTGDAPCAPCGPGRGDGREAVGHCPGRDGRDERVSGARPST